MLTSYRTSRIEKPTTNTSNIISTSSCKSFTGHLPCSRNGVRDDVPQARQSQWWETGDLHQPSPRGCPDQRQRTAWNADHQTNENAYTFHSPSTSPKKKRNTSTGIFYPSSFVDKDLRRVIDLAWLHTSLLSSLRHWQRKDRSPIKIAFMVVDPSSYLRKLLCEKLRVGVIVSIHDGCTGVRRELGTAT